MPILRDWLMGRELFQPDIIIMMQAGLIVIDKNGCGNVHCVAQNDPFLNTAFLQAFFYLGRNVNKSSAGRHLKPEFFTIAVHIGLIVFCPGYILDKDHLWEQLFEMQRKIRSPNIKMHPLNDLNL
jgi:hypothetical protein